MNVDALFKQYYPRLRKLVPMNYKKLLLLLIALTSAILPLLSQSFKGEDCLYDMSPTALTPAPEGFEPVYISQYARHGSRYAYTAKAYTVPLDMLRKGAAAGNLTDRGVRLLSELEKFWELAQYKVGDLTPLGWEQHRWIAANMVKSFPSVFVKGSKVDACSSASVRSILSMASCCASIAREAPGTKVYGHQGILDIQATRPNQGRNPFRYEGPEFSFPYPESMEEFWMRKAPDCSQIFSRLFKDPVSGVGDTKPYEALFYYYMFVSGMQSVPEEERVYVDDLLTDEEFAALWEADNYGRFYEYFPYRTSCCSIVDDIIAKADGRLAGNSRGADLRFGHDHVLLTLLMIMDIDDFGYFPTSADDLKNYFQSFRSPKAANIQFIFYTPKRGRSKRGVGCLVKVLLNGEESRLGKLTPVDGPYYEWSAVKEYLNSRTGILVGTHSSTQRKEWLSRPDGFSKRYKMDKVVILSRHNIRTPLVVKGSVLTRLTDSDYKWFAWEGEAATLTPKGERLETLMGSFFKQWMDENGMLSGYGKDPYAFRFYANAMQRCQATARFFADALLPGKDPKVEMNVQYDTMDPVFHPQITKISPEFEQRAQNELDSLMGDLNAHVAKQYALIEKVISISGSPAYPDTASFSQFPASVGYRLNAEPYMNGGLKMACSISDALVLQYYEEPDGRKAAFGQTLTIDDWTDIASVVEWYVDALFTMPSVAINVAHPLLLTILSEIRNENRVFSFLCGHDSNIGSVLASLEAEPYELEGTIEKHIPIGSKVVIEKFTGKDGKEYADIWLVYASAEQLRNESVLSFTNPPLAYQVRLNGLTENSDGLYALPDVEQRITKAINAY